MKYLGPEMRKALKFLPALFVIIFGLSCSSSTRPNTDDLVFPETGVYYSLLVERYLNQTCAWGGCHDQISKQGGIDLSTYNAIFMTPGLVIPGNADGSLLNQIIEARLPHPQLPNLYRGTDNQIRGMRVWVLEGALFIKP